MWTSAGGDGAVEAKARASRMSEFDIAVRFSGLNYEIHGHGQTASETQTPEGHLGCWMGLALPAFQFTITAGEGFDHLRYGLVGMALIAANGDGRKLAGMAEIGYGCGVSSGELTFAFAGRRPALRKTR